MLRKINAIKARQTLGQLMDAVKLGNDEYIIERKGKPVAALVPVWMVLNKRKRAEEGLKVLSEARKNIDKEVNEEEIQDLIQEAIENVRIEDRDEW